MVPAKVEEINLSVDSPTISLGSAAQLHIGIVPADVITEPVALSSSDPGIVYICEDGMMIATGVGTAMITVSAESGISENCEMTVSDTDKILRIPARVKIIDREAFEGSAAAYAVVPNGCNFIGTRAFAECGRLHVIILPSSVSEIAEDSFEDCSYLVLKAPENSYAQEYASLHSIPFVPAD